MLATMPMPPLTLAGVNEDVIGFMAVAGTFTVVIIAIVSTQLRNILQTRAREATKREIAAYVAEGSMTPDDAARLLGNDQNDFERKIGEAVKWGMISAGKAEKLIKSLREDEESERGRCGKPGY